MIDLERVRVLLAQEAARFCRSDEIARARDDVEALRGFVAAAEPEGERALFAAIALAVLNDRTGLELLRHPNRYFMTNCSVEVGLANAARVLLGDLTPPIQMINASMLGSLANALGAGGGE